MLFAGFTDELPATISTTYMQEQSIATRNANIEKTSSTYLPVDSTKESPVATDAAYIKPESTIISIERFKGNFIS